MMDVKKFREMLKEYNDLDSQMTDLIDDFTDEGWKKFEKLCDRRDGIGDNMIEMMISIGIDLKTARSMLLNKEVRENLTALVSRAA